MDGITRSASDFDHHHAQANYQDSFHNVKTVCPPQTKQGSLVHGCHHDCPTPGSGSLSPKKSGRRLGNAWLEPEDVHAAFLERTCQASRKHRAKNSEALALRQRIIRLETFDKKHGPHAWLKRQNLLEERRAEAQAEGQVDEPQVPQEELTGWWPRI
ncbi:hypothetical protein B0H14DRAFT_3455197 [Mycena olivaceomarginata]|nr:hypothetical protein B0H14DRAFT_3455197 [Mycena olivaceomarginata]